jgi:hypothetical protein
MSMTPEERKVRNAECQRRYHEANKDKVAEKQRRYREANKEKMAEQNRQYREANKEKEAERKRRYAEANKDKVAEYQRRYEEANKEKMAERSRRRHRQIAFLKEDGLSFQAWLASLKNRTLTFIAIANLQPDPGQTLAELIHELSGYAMEVCEQIANPPVTEDNPALTPPAAPDLF